MLRNSLTTIGISVGVASLVAMLSLGIGLQQLAGRRLQKSGLFDTVVVTSRRDLRRFSRDQEENGPAPADSAALDESARQRIAQLPNVIEAYPDIRFITELRYEDKPHLTMVAGLPFSARNSDAFDGMQGAFFTSETATEAVLQKSFAAQLLGKTARQGGEDVSVVELANPLLGRQLTMRYAERPASPQTETAASGAPDGSAGTAYSVVSHEIVLTIVGVSDLDPDSMRGQARARVFLPL